MKSHAREVKEGNRFEFGKNWSLFLSGIDEDRIRVAVESLQQYLGVNDLRGKTFLDVGSGSGLFSLAARRLGARVHSFDYDPESVACGRELRRRFDNENPDWTVEEGSALDPVYLKSLGTFDVVYSWGVLHHTGAMWQALENVICMVAPGGKLFIAIYNDQGTISRRWTAIKKLYNRTPALRFPISFLTAAHFLWKPMLKDILKGRPGAFISSYRNRRGMSYWRDIVDWVGGYPFEVAKPEQIIHFYRDHGFWLRYLKTCGGALGCNEFVFETAPVTSSDPASYLVSTNERVRRGL